ncbi:MAG: hypothetical protein H0V37_04045 [Chloroflexia bacterium]|nr:hypothetical protein [Chloroflexia bacterium]
MPTGPDRDDRATDGRATDRHASATDRHHRAGDRHASATDRHHRAGNIHDGSGNVDHRPGNVDHRARNIHDGSGDFDHRARNIHDGSSNVNHCSGNVDNDPAHRRADGATHSNIRYRDHIGTQSPLPYRAGFGNGHHVVPAGHAR